MAMMQKMTLGQATGGGDGKLKKFIKRKVQGYKMKQAQKRMDEVGGEYKPTGGGVPNGTPMNERQANRQEKKAVREINRGVRKDNRLKKMGESNRASLSGKTISGTPVVRKIDKFSTKVNKYSHPGLYKVAKVVKNIGDSFEQMAMNVKKNKGRRLAMADAAGPTSRNRDVTVCRNGSDCQK
jgi:hypothetical protein